MVVFIQLGRSIVVVLMDFLVMIADRVHFAKMRSQISVKMVELASKWMDLVKVTFSIIKKNVFFSVC